MTANPQGPVRVVPEALVKFLLGEGPWRGRDFGDAPPKTAAGWPVRYWWRQDLRSAPELNTYPERVSKSVETEHDAPSPAAPEGVEGWREIAEYSGCGPVLVSTAPDSPKYLASDPVTAFKDATGVWRCLGSIGGCEPLALQPTHFAPMPKRPTLPPVPLADGGR